VRLGALATVAERDVSKDAELLVVRHENAVLRRHVEKVCHQVEDRVWFAGLSGLIPRHRWAEVFPVTPGIGDPGHRWPRSPETKGRLTLTRLAALPEPGAIKTPLAYALPLSTRRVCTRSMSTLIPRRW
jgi:hypothetical protein